MRIRTKKKKRNPFLIRVRRLILGLVLTALAAPLIQVLMFKYVNPPMTVNMAWERLHHELDGTRYMPAVYLWRNLDEISPHLRQAVLASEDQRFMHHHGFDTEEIKAVIRNIRKGKSVRGASTITMQAARSLFLPFSRTVWRKAAEAWYTVLMEQVWDKRRILEIYLNTVDWGTGVVGAQAAARRYFSCDASQLRKGQAALLAAILPSPHKWSPQNPTPFLKQRQRRIMRDMPKMPRL